MATFHFAPIPPDLPEAEQAARLKRQHQAEWGMAVARLGGTEPSPAILQELQRYTDGQLSLEALVGLASVPGPVTQALVATVQREQFTR